MSRHRRPAPRPQTPTRQPRARVSPQPAPTRPVYVRVLGLRHLRLSGVACFFLFEGMIALGVVLALAELAEWWAVPVLPAAVAAMVKVNDLIAGASSDRRRPVGRRRRPRRARPLVEQRSPVSSPRQRVHPDTRQRYR